MERTQTDYAQLVVFYNGREIEQIESCSHKTDPGQQPVDTMKYGLSGFNQTSGHVEINIGFVVPIGGPEENYQGDSIKGDFVTIQIGMGGLGYAAEGKITAVEISQSTNQPIKGSFTWYGQKKAFE